MHANSLTQTVCIWHKWHKLVDTKWLSQVLALWDICASINFFNVMTTALMICFQYLKGAIIYMVLANHKQCVTKNHSYYEIVLHCSKMAVLARWSQVVQHMMGSIKLKNWIKQQEASSVCAIVNAMSENAVIFQLHTVALHNVNSAHKSQLSSHIKVCFIYFLSA